MKAYFFISGMMVLLLTQVALFANTAPKINGTMYTEHQIEWSKQYGITTDGIYRDNDTAIDSSGNIYVVSETRDGNDEVDVLLTKYSSDGTQIWSEKYGTDSFDDGRSVTVDSQGNVYVAGSTNGEFDGYAENNTYSDIFLSKFSSEGTLLWTRQYGTWHHDYGRAVTTDNSGNIYVTGYTDEEFDGYTNSGSYDIFLTKFSSEGIALWTVQYGGSSGDVGESVTSDGTDIYIVGTTNGDLDGNTNSGRSDIFFTKFSGDGTKLWTKQFGTDTFDKGYSIVADSRNHLYITGSTEGELHGNTNNGSSDIFLSKYSNDGTRIWTRVYGSSGKWDSDQGRSVTLSPRGDVYITGSVEGDIDGAVHIGGEDIFLTKYSSDGVRLWTEIYGTDSQETGDSVVVDSSDNIYVLSNTDSTSTYDGDVTLIKFRQAMQIEHHAGTKAVIDIDATDGDGDTLTYSISGGVDKDLFLINSTTGALSFINTPKLDIPLDDNSDNVYEVQVSVSDGNGGSDRVNLSIVVDNYMPKGVLSAVIIYLL